MAAKAAAAGAATSEAGGKTETPTTTPDAGKTTENAGKTGDQAAAGKTSDDGAGKTKTDDQAGKTGDEGKEPKSGKTDDSSKTGDEGAAAQTKAPEKYELTVADDAKRYVSDDDLAFIEEVARANDWTNEEAQTELTAMVERAAAARAKTIESWEGETKKDKTYGAKNLGESQRLGNLVIDRVYPKDHPMRERFIGFLKESGGGVRLEVVAFLADLGRMMGEDRPTGGKTTTSSGEKADKFYDHPSSKKVAAEAAGQS